MILISIILLSKFYFYFNFQPLLLSLSLSQRRRLLIRQMRISLMTLRRVEGSIDDKTFFRHQFYLTSSLSFYHRFQHKQSHRYTTTIQNTLSLSIYYLSTSIFSHREVSPSSVYIFLKHTYVLSKYLSLSHTQTFFICNSHLYLTTYLMLSIHLKLSLSDTRYQICIQTPSLSIHPFK